jgi:hypothetical protein
VEICTFNLMVSLVFSNCKLLKEFSIPKGYNGTEHIVAAQYTFADWVVLGFCLRLACKCTLGKEGSKGEPALLPKPTALVFLDKVNAVHSAAPFKVDASERSSSPGNPGVCSPFLEGDFLCGQGGLTTKIKKMCIYLCILHIIYIHTYTHIYMYICLSLVWTPEIWILSLHRWFWCIIRAENYCTWKRLPSQNLLLKEALF